VPRLKSEDKRGAALEAAHGLARSVYAVVLPNRNELIALLDGAASDADLAVELFRICGDRLHGSGSRKKSCARFTTMSRARWRWLSTRAASCVAARGP